MTVDHDVEESLRRGVVRDPGKITVVSLANTCNKETKTVTIFIFSPAENHIRTIEFRRLVVVNSVGEVSLVHGDLHGRSTTRIICEEQLTCEDQRQGFNVGKSFHKRRPSHFLIEENGESYSIRTVFRRFRCKLPCPRFSSRLRIPGLFPIDHGNSMKPLIRNAPFRHRLS
jgi:hypothetical protein